ncbi:MAG: hypothetical protein COV75_07745 [Candidatus Omnitrophica bacterium CG11_big_fil_rev_8_21_14_0_20_63_9]|nr:MAG: hypothetical protein COV75_07745 [Candidatus Omnitrophica bacterium CG11_big_fil_rev_8_21_14_0_20_63_9]
MKPAWGQIITAGALGAGLTLAAVRGGIVRPRYHWNSAQVQAHLLTQLEAKLKLSPEQRTQIAVILDAKRQKIDALRAELRPKFDAVRTSTSADIRQLLTPQQQPAFDALEADWEARKARWRERREGRDGK